MVVGRSSKQRSFLCDTILGETFLEFISTFEEVDPTSLMSSRDDAMPRATAFAGRSWLHEHPGGHVSWRDPTMRQFKKESTTYFVRGSEYRWNTQKIESNGFTSNQRISIALESCFDEHGQDAWEINWKTPEVQTTLLNTYPPELIATILKGLREQLKENDQLNVVQQIARPVLEMPIEKDQILQDGGGFWDEVNGGYLPEDFALTAGREEIAWVHSGCVYEIVPMQKGTDAGKKPLGPIWVETGPRSKENSVQTVCQRIQDEETESDSKSSSRFSVVLCVVIS